MGSVGSDRQQNPAEFDTVEHRWKAHELHLSEARTVVSEWLEVHGISAMRSVLHLVVTELLSNAREASEPADPITLRLDIDDGAIEVEVENIGVDFEPCFDMPDALSLRGRGLSLVSAMAESVVVEHSRGRTRVAVCFRP